VLTINDDKLTLHKQIAELTEKSKEENYIIKGKLSEKDRELELCCSSVRHSIMIP
jgi:hypothetical protein